MGDRKREQQHGHDAPHLFSILLACKCSERALGRRGVTAQAGLLHPSALQTPGAHGGIPARSQERARFPGKGCSCGSGGVHARRVRSWAGLYISAAPARKSGSENPSEVKKSLTVPQHNARGSPWPVVDAGLGGEGGGQQPPIPTQ